MTSNIPNDRHIGFSHEDTAESRDTVLGEVKNRFRAEFINRIDEQIVFRPLRVEDVQRILEMILAEVSRSFTEKFGKHLHFTDNAIKQIVDEGYRKEYGVRHLSRIVQKRIEVPLSKIVVAGKIETWPGVEFKVEDGNIVLQPLSAITFT